MFCSRCGTEYQESAKFCPSCGLDLAATTPLAAVVEPTEPTELDQVKAALKDEYEIIEELGRGGMAIVFKARERQLERDVAVKVLPFSLAFDGEFVERFQREARTAASLEHVNIIPIYRVGKLGRVIFFVMKFLRGESLSEHLEKCGKLPPDEIRKILIQTAGALGYAHKNEIVHRDIKPDNIMFDESRNAILTDFGIAKAATGTRLTGTGMSIGTPHYMSPEQARAQTLDGRSDIYSLGVVAYQCLAGVVPFDGEDSFSIGYKHIMEDLTEPEMETAEQRALYAIIERMMAKSPEDRYQTAEDLVAAVEGPIPALTRLSDSSFSEAPTAVLERPTGAVRGTVPGAATPTPTTPTTPMPQTSPSSEPVKKKKRGMVLVGMLLFLIVGGGSAGGYWYFFMDAEWPLPFMAQSTEGDPSLAEGDPTLPPDSVLLAGADSVLAANAESTSTGTPSSEETADTTTEEVVEEPVLPSTGTLVVRFPDGARLSIDGSRSRQDSVELSPGNHTIRVTRDGFQAFEQTVRIERGQMMLVGPVELVAEPEPEPAQPTGPTNPVPPPNTETVDCETDSPGPAYFTANTCYDTPPSPTGVPIITIGPEETGNVAAVQLLVKVGTNGRAMRVVRGRRQQAAQTLQMRALLFARDSLEYMPAVRGTQPVEAWARVTVRFRRR
ncbi:MAG: protein kinase [Myxococcota bacterium]|nr:protein kinase [Myxococcota bacterium]